LGEDDGIDRDENGKDPDDDYSEHTGSGDTAAQAARMLVQFKAKPKNSKATGKEPLGETGGETTADEEFGVSAIRPPPGLI
jgi:hypothetical protein